MATESVLAPYLLPADEVARRLGTETAAGLGNEEAAVRLRHFGPNRLQQAEVRSAGEILIAQFKDFLIVILIAAAVLAGMLGEGTDAVAIGVILLLNAVLGFFQEYRAEHAMAAPHATVVRDGIRQSIPAADVVPGDVCVLEAGAAVPADMRLVEAASLRIDEAALTGESLPSEKDTGRVVDAETPLAEHPRVGEVPFDGARKRMTTVHRRGDDRIAFVKGAVDVVVMLSSKLATAAGEVALTSEVRATIERRAERLAERGLRVLGLARRTFAVEPDLADSDAVERDLTFLGIVAMADPPRPEAAAAVAECHAAGIRPVMITGDHPLTARTIAARLAIYRDGDVVVSGRELEQMSDADLAAAFPAATVFARVAPEHKLRIVRALQANGEVVAMTGDGVNDAPALKQADIGVAMGITGTDVAKEAAEMVLLDDRFNTIVNAVREGRRIYDNIRHFVRYMFAANAGEIWVMLLAPFFGYPLPLLPIQILWINLVTDGSRQSRWRWSRRSAT